MTRSTLFQKSLLVTAVAIGALCANAWRAEAGAYVQTNLVSDGFLPAELTDPTLVNPWGVSHSATSPFWTSNQGTSTTSLFNVPPPLPPKIQPSRRAFHLAGPAWDPRAKSTIITQAPRVSR
jgi:hypothetical protein